MDVSANLHQLIDEQRVWRGHRAVAGVRASAARRTGVAALDAVLPEHGWPEAGLLELLLPHDGIGELSLLMPLLAQATRPIVVIAPPYAIDATAWQAHGVRLQLLHWVRCDARDVLWATEQALRAGCCAAVLAWPKQADDKALRRLQVAGEAGRCLGVVFRDAKHAINPSPAPWRLALRANNTSTQLQLIKCRGVLPPARPIDLPLAMR